MLLLLNAIRASLPRDLADESTPQPLEGPPWAQAPVATGATVTVESNGCGWGGDGGSVEYLASGDEAPEPNLLALSTRFRLFTRRTTDTRSVLEPAGTGGPGRRAPPTDSYSSACLYALDPPVLVTCNHHHLSWSLATTSVALQRTLCGRPGDVLRPHAVDFKSHRPTLLMHFEGHHRLSLQLPPPPLLEDAGTHLPEGQRGGLLWGRSRGLSHLPSTTSQSLPPEAWLLHHYNHNQTLPPTPSGSAALPARSWAV